MNTQFFHTHQLTRCKRLCRPSKDAYYLVAEVLNLCLKQFLISQKAPYILQQFCLPLIRKPEQAFLCNSQYPF